MQNDADNTADLIVRARQGDVQALEEPAVHLHHGFGGARLLERGVSKTWSHAVSSRYRAPR